jgi:phosphoribosylamine--glycine ligase
MLTAEGPKVLEFNVRFGDPECQPILMRLEGDLVSLLQATIEGNLHQIQARWSAKSAVCVVLCAGGYPGVFTKGKTIHGLEKLSNWQRGFVFHAATARAGEEWLTAGGRVLNVAALGCDLQEAVKEAYRAVREIKWDDMHYRTDIAQRGLQ